MSKSNRGFAAMIKNDPDRQRAIASDGGKKSGGNFARDRAKASRAGKIGGSRSRRTR